jgi:hypothetical protein
VNPVGAKANVCITGFLENQLHSKSAEGELVIDLADAQGSGNNRERRERSRVALRLKCRVERPGQPDRRSWMSVENISRGGMLIRWGLGHDAPPAVGDVLIVKLKLPLNPVFGQRWMLFNASVVRVTQTDAESVMVAVTGAPVRFSPSLGQPNLPTQSEKGTCELPEDRNEHLVY